MINTIAEILNQICKATAWEYGEAWILNADSPVLELSPAWSIKSGLTANQILSWSQFQRCSQSCVLKIGEGLPGRVWAAKHSEWIVDTSASSEAYFLRNQIARAFGVKAGLGLPIPAGESVQAVLVFFMSEACLENRQLIEQTQAIAAQLLIFS